eukprot:317312_1
MSHLRKAVVQWTNEEFMSFISSLGIKGKPYNQIKIAMDENGLAAADIKGRPLDIKELFGINMILAKKISNSLIKLNVDQKVNYNAKSPPNRAPSTAHHAPFALPSVPSRQRCAPSIRSTYGKPYYPSTKQSASKPGRDAFHVNLRGKQGKMTTLRNSFTRNSTVAEVARSYKEQECLEMSYKVEKIVLTSRNKVLQHSRTLGYYGIVTSRNLITVIFKTKGGAMAAYDGMDRRIRFRKHGLRQTSLPDVLIGYDDNDGIPRALLECGRHAMTAETMFMYIKSSLSNNLEQTDIVCPGTPDKGCGKVLSWQTCTQIADMNAREYMKWTDLIEKRAMINYKQCPHCQAYCLRDDGVAIFRMSCIACDSGDWCWECCQPWKGSGHSMCCNQNCDLIVFTNTKLLTCPMIKVSDTGVEIPQFRACPRCVTFIEYSEACKHMICSGCDKEFCFVCLGLQDSEGNWPCGDHTTVCEMAPRQQFK